MSVTTQEAVRELLESTSDPAYSVDDRGCLSGWNDGAERLLGHPREEILGRPCHEILRGRDIFGNPYCEPDCPLLLLARRRRPVRHFQMDVYGKGGRAHRVLCFVVVLPASPATSFSVIHLLRPLDRPLRPWRRQGATDRPPLTEREMETLRLLAAGSTTPELAETMNISTSTVRKHVQNLLRKLKAGSRLGAVMAAFERRIL